MQKIHGTILQKAYHSLKKEGVKGCASRTKKYLKKRIIKQKRPENVYKDILFISGCKEELPHPRRYRVSHQREQLEAYNYSTDEVYYLDLEAEQIRNYRMFVVFRCPYTETLGKFVGTARELNKKVFYDIDDLVVDTKYTDLIAYVREMQQEEKEAYDANVGRMKKMLKNCDAAIVSTDCLAEKLKDYTDRVYINRNAASEEMVRLSQKALENSRKDGDKVKIGYFSGSITHNEDFELIRPVILDIMKRHSAVELYLAGELDLPKQMEGLRSRIRKLPFMDWKKLPFIMGQMDVNLAPLQDTVFNRAKSENKWVEAALVKVATIASDVGAFHDCIENEKTGILCSSKEEWESALERLITDESYRKAMGEQAYRYCVEKHTTINRGGYLAEILKNEENDNYVFVLPGLQISGGIKVALKHAAVLQKAGKEVTLFVLEGDNGWCRFEGRSFPVVSLEHTQISARIQHMVATMWTTVGVTEEYAKVLHRYYLVQNFETDFYKKGDPLRLEANRFYRPAGSVRFLTISKWCQSWLKEKYGQEAFYAPNGLEVERFTCHRREMKGKIRILVEGDCAVDYKNVDEAFHITNGLDQSMYEVWYMSYNARPKDWYRIDRFCHKVPYHEVPAIYEACDILLKTSLLESFSYPPIEMMAAGGYVVAVPNGGNAEYLKDGVNCMLYEAGELGQAKALIERIRTDEALQSVLYQNGRRTAEARAWERIEADVLCLYGAERKSSLPVGKGEGGK
ncbi:glycosyltransferase [Clostridiaceae bacterium 68-1-5]|uniref:Glycosyltransferase n=1 Tax=Suipraeoptans intestinalis TaxID=2606628 RepID=A0A6N7URM0_9FIRM|nr:glycosyltransferase [Suipraeoptans intestinalis]MSR93098.1 glycosyltransferase [Suipraeoptans intestinalis]